MEGLKLTKNEDSERIVASFGGKDFNHLLGVIRGLPGERFYRKSEKNWHIVPSLVNLEYIFNHYKKYLQGKKIGIIGTDYNGDLIDVDIKTFSISCDNQVIKNIPIAKIDAQIDIDSLLLVCDGFMAFETQRGAKVDYSNVAFKPTSHQLNGAEFIINSRRASILAWDMGCMKTSTVIMALHVLQPEKTVIFCPNKVIGNWLQEIESFFPHLLGDVQGITAEIKPKYRVHIFQTTKIVILSYDLWPNIVDMVAKPIYNKILEIENKEYRKKTDTVYSITDAISIYENYLMKLKPDTVEYNEKERKLRQLQAVITRLKKQAHQTAVNQLLPRGFFLILDEVHKIRNNTRRSMYTESMARLAGKIVGLSGTLIINDYIELFRILKVVEPMIFGRNEYKFRMKYFHNVGRGKFPIWEPRDGAIEKINKLTSFMISKLTKEEVLPDLPLKKFIYIKADMSGEQKKAYKQVETELRAVIDDEEVTLTNKLSIMIKTLQISSGFIYNEEKQPILLDSAYENKYHLMGEIINENAGKIIIWTVHRQTRELIKTYLRGHKILFDLSGDWLEWIKNDKKVLICGLGEAAEGLNLQVASTAIVMEPTLKQGDFLQAMDRNHRKGSTKPVTIFFIHSSRVEKKIYRYFEKKKEVLNDFQNNREILNIIKKEIT